MGCPRCSSEKFVEIMADVTVTSDCWLKYGVIQHGEQTSEGGVVAHYECANCGMGLCGDNGLLITKAEDVIAFWEKATRRVEMGICYADKTWQDSQFIDIPANTPEDKVESVVRDILMKNCSGIVGAFKL